MPEVEVLNRFIQRVESGAHAQACEEFYTEDSSMTENRGTPRIGRAAHVANERRIHAKVRSIESSCRGPVFVSGDWVVIRWFFRFHWLDGAVSELDELAYQRWEGNRIAEEIFYYDPAQAAPRPREPA